MVTIKCPECDSDFARRVSRAGLAEKFVSFFYVYPFECQLCGHRFSSFQRGVRYFRVEEDRRDYYRSQVNCPITFSGQKISGEGTLFDLSMGGCSFSTDTDVAFGMILKLAVRISASTSPVIVEALVRHVSTESVGVEFIRWQDSERERLRPFVRDLMRSKGQRVSARVGYSDGNSLTNRD